MKQPGHLDARCDLCGCVVAACTLRRRHVLMPGVGQWLVQAVCAGEEACYLRGRDPVHWHRVGAAVPASLPPQDALLARCFLCDAAASPTDLVIEVGVDDQDRVFIDARCSDTRLCDERQPSSLP